MKTLHLLRHAKSAWDEPVESDRERGLNKRGRRDAPRMGAALAAELEPQALAVSPARRAQLTLAGLTEGWPALRELEHETVEELYTFDVDDLVDWLQTQPEPRACRFLLGHNPAMTDLVNWLSGEEVLENLPTAAYARLQLNIDQWAQLAPACGRLERLILPRELEG